MSQKRILVVEDEAIVAKNIERGLKKLGYAVPALASSGEEAIEKATSTRPDLILMDIKLRGEMTGIEAAIAIRRRLDIPVVYLTAYADDATLSEAKTTEPVGYLVKPFEMRELHSTIEMALYRQEMENRLKESEERYRSFVQNFQGIAFRGRIDFSPLFFHGAVEEITGFTEAELVAGQPSWAQMIHPADWPTVLESGAKLQEAQSHSMEREYRIVRKDGETRWIHEFIQNICDARGQAVGVQGAVYDITERKRADEERERLLGELQDALAKVKTLSGLLPICASCKRIRDDQGYWTQVEVYIRDHSEARFSHGLCPDCAAQLYPGFFTDDT
jgi:PAS domain S-box-containing protein